MINYKMCLQELEDKLFEWHDIACQEEYCLGGSETHKNAIYKQKLIEGIQRLIKELKVKYQED